MYRYLNDQIVMGISTTGRSGSIRGAKSLLNDQIGWEFRQPAAAVPVPALCTDSLCECGCVRSGLAVVVRW